MNGFSELDTQRLLMLVKAALYNFVPDRNLFFHATDAEWQTLFKQSVEQGVMVLTFQGVLRLPKALHPPHALKIRWIASVESVEKRYRHQFDTARQLAACFEENNIRMLLFKGLSLARYYPIPDSREFGDIDIFLFGKAKEGDALLERLTDKNKVYSKKHATFDYRDLLIEHHHSFLNHGIASGFRRSDSLEKRLWSALETKGLGDNRPVSAIAMQAENTLLFPPSAFDLLFIMLHTLAHLSSSIVLRFLCDITVFFTTHKGKLDFTSYTDALSEAGLQKSADALISLSVRYLGLNPNDAPPYKPDGALEDRIWSDMMNPAMTPPKKGKRALLKVCMYKLRLFRSNRWKYELVFPGKYWKKVFYSVLFHIRHPAMISKLKD